MAKKKTDRIVQKGRIYIVATFNNTIITVTDEKGNPIVIDSTGMHGFTGARKSTPYAATVTTQSALKKAIEKHGFRQGDVFVKGIGPGRQSSLRAISLSDIDISRIIDITPVPHNGVRPPKIRRM